MRKLGQQSKNTLTRLTTKKSISASAGELIIMNKQEGIEQRAKNKAFHRKVFDESALPEPQRIKQELIDQYFQGCDLIAKINYRRKVSGCMDTANGEKLSMCVQSLLLKLAMKDAVKESEVAQAAIKNIRTGQTVVFTDCFDLILLIGDILQEIGPLKIEIIKGVKPEFAAAEGMFMQDQ